MARAVRDDSKPSRLGKKLTQRCCLRCDHQFWSEGPHHRLCQSCRQAIAASASPVEEYCVLLSADGAADPLSRRRFW